MHYSEYTTVDVSDGVYFIGGRHCLYKRGSFTQYKNNEWIELPSFEQLRAGHISLRVGSQTIIFGGQGYLKTEVWNHEFSDKREIEPLLHDVYHHSLAFVIDEQFCNGYKGNIMLQK